MKTRLSRTQLLAEIAGWYGTAAILLAYILVSFNAISGNDITFQLLNLTGAIGFIIIASYKKVKQTVVLNAFWGAIAVVAILNILW